MLTLSLVGIALEYVGSTEFKDVGELFFAVVLFTDNSLLFLVADV